MEYLHYDLGESYYSVTGNGVVGGGGSEARVGYDYAIRIRGGSANRAEIVQVGLNYRFGATNSAPLVARY
jgi:hypothetical protein